MINAELVGAIKVSPSEKTIMPAHMTRTPMARGSAIHAATANQNKPQEKPVVARIFIRLRPDKRFETKTCASTMVVALKRVITPIRCTE